MAIKEGPFSANSATIPKSQISPVLRDKNMLIKIDKVCLELLCEACRDSSLAAWLAYYGPYGMNDPEEMVALWNNASLGKGPVPLRCPFITRI